MPQKGAIMNNAFDLPRSATRDELHILKRRKDVIEARQAAEKEYDLFFATYHQHIGQSTHFTLLELFADYGEIGYLIRIQVEAPEQKMLEIKDWTGTHIHSDR